MSWQLAASFVLLGLALVGRLRLVRARAARRAGARARRHARRARRARARSPSRRCPNVKPTTDIVLLSRLRARRRARASPSGAVAALASNLVLRAGAVDAVADGRLGRWSACSARRSGAARRARASGACRWPLACGAGRAAVRRDPRLSTWVTFSGDAHARRRTSRCQRDVAAVQHRPRGRQRRLLPGLRAGASCARCCASARASRCAGSRPPRGRGARRGAGARWRRRAGAERRAPRRARRPTCARPERRRRLRRRAAAQRSTELYTAWAAMGLAARGATRRRRARGRALDYLARARGAAQRDIGDIERTILALRARASTAPRRRPRPRRTRCCAPPARDGSFAGWST